MIIKELVAMDVTTFTLLIENKDRGDAKNLVLFLNLYHH